MWSLVWVRHGLPPTQYKERSVNRFNPIDGLYIAVFVVKFSNVFWRIVLLFSEIVKHFRNIMDVTLNDESLKFICFVIASSFFIFLLFPSSYILRNSTNFLTEMALGGPILTTKTEATLIIGVVIELNKVKMWEASLRFRGFTNRICNF